MDDIIGLMKDLQETKDNLCFEETDKESLEKLAWNLGVSDANVMRIEKVIKNHYESKLRKHFRKKDVQWRNYYDTRLEQMEKDLLEEHKSNIDKKDKEFREKECEYVKILEDKDGKLNLVEKEMLEWKDRNLMLITPIIRLHDIFEQKWTLRCDIVCMEMMTEDVTTYKTYLIDDTGNILITAYGEDGERLKELANEGKEYDITHTSKSKDSIRCLINNVSYEIMLNEVKHWQEKQKREEVDTSKKDELNDTNSLSHSMNDEYKEEEEIMEFEKIGKQKLLKQVT